jgi:hypothetical protein
MLKLENLPIGLIKSTNLLDCGPNIVHYIEWPLHILEDDHK